MRRIALFTALAMLVAPSAHAALAKTSTLSPFISTRSMAYGRAVVVTADGNVVVFGNEDSAAFCGGGFPGVVALGLDRLLNKRWETAFVPNSTCMSGNGDVRDAVAIGTDVYVCGVHGTDGAFLTVVHADGSVGVTRQKFGLSEGFFALAVDPVDHSIWAVGNNTAAPQAAHLVHYTTGAGGPTEISDDAYNWTGTEETHAYAVAVSGDTVFVGGRGYLFANSTNRSWLIRRLKSNPAVVWQYRGTEPASMSSVWSLAARGDKLFSLYVTESGGGPPVTYAATMVRHNINSGAFEQSAATFSGNAGGSFNYRGQLAMHPNLPLLAIGGASGVRLVDFDFKEVSSIVPVSANAPADVDGVAFTDAYDFSLYTASTIQQPAAIYHAEADGSSFADNATVGGHTLTARPNVLELRDPSSTIRLRVIKVTGAVHFTIYDGAGRMIAEKKADANAGGTAEWIWDGTVDGGVQRVRPGGYLVRVDDKSGTLIDRNTLIVVSKKGK